MSVLFVLYGLLMVLSLGCNPPDCDREDCGSCGNACCNMLYYFDISVDKLLSEMQSLFDRGENGPDGRYFEQPMAEGGKGFADLTPYNLSVSYIGQVFHETASGKYNDTVDMTFATDSDTNGSWLKIFSISQIGGAWCDDGQNYKNVVTLVKALKATYTETNILGCSPGQ